MRISRRWFAIGDPQTSFTRFLRILRGHALLDANGRLRDDVGLVSIGDHFDFDGGARSLADVGRDGTDILGWLADYPRDQVVILMGNHDAARVMELSHESDESFARAREVAEKGNLKSFLAEFPRIPTPGIAKVDYSSFAVEQRALVQKLLLAGRMRLACVARRGGHSVLLTHAGITDVQIAELAVQPTAESLTLALEAQLREAVDQVRPAWERGEPATLTLAPLHFAGRAGREGGGLLYHRASASEDEKGSGAPIAPRRFHPRALPRGLVQACGHTGHHKNAKELTPWVTKDAAAQARGGLRTLSVGEESSIVYDLGIHPPREGHATVYMIDIEMNRPDVSEYPLLDLEDVLV